MTRPSPTEVSRGRHDFARLARRGYGLPAGAIERLRDAARPRRGRAGGHHRRPRSAPRASDVARRRLARGARPAGGPRRPPRSPISAPGAGFPGLALAIALPGRPRRAGGERGAQVRLPRRRRSRARARRTSRSVNARAEAWPEGLGAHDLVAARALAPLTVLVEYAAPLLGPGGRRSWPGRGAATPAEEADGAAAAAALGMSAPEADAPSSRSRGARDRHLYLSSKVSPTPTGLPAPPGNGPQTADSSLELKVMALRRRTKTRGLRPESPLA